MEGPEWKKVSAKRFGIKESMIPDEAWNVLHRLRSRGEPRPRWRCWCLV